MDTKQSNLKPCNQLIQQLKSQGLYLTGEKKVKLPICLTPPPSITTRIMSLISNQNKTFNVDAEKKIWPLEQNLVLITQANTLSSYILQKRQNDSIDLHQGQKFHFQDTISTVSFPDSMTLSDSKVFYFIVTYQKSNLISLISIKKGESQQITLTHSIKAKGDILTVQFISRCQFLVITLKNEVCQFKIEKSSLKFMREIEHLKSLTSSVNQSIMFMKLLARPKQQQQSLIAIFYATWNCQTNKCQLNIKQMFRELDGNIYVTQPVYQIFSFTSSDQTSSKKQKARQTNFYKKEHFEDVEVIKQREYFLLKLHHEIFVITKYFDKYVRLDAITQNFTSFKTLMIQHHVPLICCIGSDSMELWHVTVQSKKSNCTLMDVINLDPKNKLKESQLIKFWVMNYKQRPETIFAFDRGGRQIGFFGVKRIDKVSKLVNRITNFNQKTEIVKVQELGKKLGVQKKSLYLKLWNENPQNPSNIFLYLLQSHDLPSIHSQLQKYMRKKFISTGELIKIHTQIENILIQKLKKELNFHNLKWFLKTNFQKRKLRLFSFDTQITFKEFQNIYNSSIFDLIQKNIDKKLFPEKRVSKILWNEKPVEDPDINVYHIFQEFKLLILQNYEQFLLELLGYYRYNTADVIEHFPDILPKFPFKMDVFLNGSMMNSQLMISNLLMNQKPYEEQPMKETNKAKEFKQDGNFSYQKYWFSEVGEEEWMREKSSVDFIFNTLYPHYQTHQIMNLLTQLTESEWNEKKKFVTHCLIGTTINTFRQRVAKIQGLKLYLTVCQFVNGVKFQAQQKLSSQSTTKDVLKYLCQQNNQLKNLKVTEQSEIYNTSILNLQNNLSSQAPRILEIMRQKKLLTGEGYETCILYSKMHDLMVTKEIMKRETTISDLMTASHSTLIASFFIGERQRNSQLFKDFFPLYKDKNLFYEQLSEYINSASCSRVELEILVRQLYNLSSQHQEYNSYLAELLIHGFCMRTQLREKDEAHEIISMFNEIELKLDLALKLQKFICINKQLVGIFELFMCQKLTYQQVLNHPTNILTLMMQNYFNSNLNWTAIKNNNSIIIIQGKQIDLDIIQNTFSIFLYLKQKLYVQMSQIQLSLLYGKIMIEWQQFDVLRSVFAGQEFKGDDDREGVMLSSTQYFQKLIAKVLDQIYTKEGIYMDENTISYIESILDLLHEQTTNPLIVRERTKLQLSKLLQKWGYTIQSVALELICVKWKEENRQQLIIQIMDNCIEYFDLQALQNLYRLLQTTRLGIIVRDIRNPQSISLAYKLAEKMAAFSNQQNKEEAINKQEEISKIIYFINKNSKQYAAQIGLMAETFLRIVMKKYMQDSFILQAEIKSEINEHVRSIDNRQEQPQSAFLASRKQSMSKPHLGFDVSQYSASIGSRIKDKFHYESKNSQNNADISKISVNKKVLNANDPINALHFDDSVVLQRILNLFCKVGSETRKSIMYHEITDLKDWHSKGRSIVEYFVLNWQNTQVINEMFRNKFTREVWLNNQIKSLSVNKEITFKLEESMKQSQLLANSTKVLWSVNIDLDILWEVTVSVSKQYIHNYIQVLKHRTREFHELLSEKFCKVLYYGYFFLLMSLRFPSSILHLTSIEYQNIPNLFIINELESKAKNKLNNLNKINFQNIWMNFYQGLKSLMIKNLQILLPETKIPNDIETKLIQRLINDIKKQKPEMVLNMKILSMIENSIRKYVKQEKPKVLHELKSVYESMMIELSISQGPLMRKKSSQTRRLTNNEMKITVKDIQELKSRIQQLSNQSINHEDQGIMKEIAQIFEDVKRVKQIDNQESVKDVILKKMLNKRQINVSEIMSGRTEKDEIVPFESSIVLQNRTIMHENGSNSQIGVKNTSSQRISKYEDPDNFFQDEYFQNHEFKFDSLIDHSHDQNEETIEQKLFQDGNNIDDILSKSNLPYLHLIKPQQIINRLASKDSKFESKFHFTYPIPENMIEKIKEFAKIINSYELYFGKNSQYYIQQNVKKMLAYSHENILQILQQIYFEEDSILVTLSPKQFQTYHMRKSKGLNCQEQKYKKTLMSFILQLLKSLDIVSLMSFQALLQVVKDYQSKVHEEKTKDLLIQHELKQLKKIFPLCDLASADNGKSFQDDVETIFGRVNLSQIAINDEIPLYEFQNFISFIENLIQEISKQFKQEKRQQQQIKVIYQPAMLKNSLSFMLILQIVRTKNATEKTRKKLQFLLTNISKQFILQTHQLLQSLFATNPQLQQLFTVTVVNRLTSQ